MYVSLQILTITLFHVLLNRHFWTFTVSSDDYGLFVAINNQSHPDQLNNGKPKYVAAEMAVLYCDGMNGVLNGS